MHYKHCLKYVLSLIRNISGVVILCLMCAVNGVKNPTLQLRKNDVTPPRPLAKIDHLGRRTTVNKMI